MDIILQAHDSEPLYLQLYRNIRTLILEGALTDGTKLPSVRSLEQLLQISKTPIETAYQMLIAEGYALSRPRSGLYVVNPDTLQHPRESGMTMPQQAIDGVQPTLPPAGAAANHHEPAADIDFNLLSVDDESFPVRAWRAALNEALSSPVPILQQYGDPQGEYGLRDALARYLRTSRGVLCSPDQLFIGTSISQSIHLLSQLFAPSRTVAFEQGGIAQVRNLFERNGFRIVDVPLDDPSLRHPALSDPDLSLVYVTPSHRPSGSPLPYAIRAALLQWACAAEDRYVIEDDYEGEFRYAGRTIPSLQGMDARGRVVYAGTFSKAFSPALRMNYIVLPDRLADRLRERKHLLACPSRIDQIAMQTFIAQGHWARQIRRMRHLYRRKRALLASLIETHLHPHARIEGDNAGLHLELAVQASCTAGELQRLAADAGVRVYVPEREPSPAPLRNPKVYLGFGGIRHSDMERGIRLLRQAWASVLR